MAAPFKLRTYVYKEESIRTISLEAERWGLACIAIADDATGRFPTRGAHKRAELRRVATRGSGRLSIA